MIFEKDRKVVCSDMKKLLVSLACMAAITSTSSVCLANAVNITDSEGAAVRVYGPYYSIVNTTVSTYYDAHFSTGGGSTDLHWADVDFSDPGYSFFVWGGGSSATFPVTGNFAGLGGSGYKSGDYWPMVLATVVQEVPGDPYIVNVDTSGIVVTPP